MRSMSFITILLLLLCNGALAHASDDLDYEEARALLEAGKIVAVEPMIADAKRRHSGRLLEIELEYEDGQYLYEIEILDSNGQVIEFYYDAGTGEFINESLGD